MTVEPHRLFQLEFLEKDSYALKSSRNFDRESIAFYQIEVRARDNGQPSHRRSMTFELNITDINDHQPFFTENYTFIILENNRIPMQIGQIHCIDLDEGINGQVTYQLINTTNQFYLSSHDGILWTNISFDYEREKEIRLLIKAMDHGQPSLEALVYVHIHIDNVNEYPPEFEHEIYRFSLYENSTINNEQQRKIIGQVKAMDRDADDPIRYSISTDQDLFQIDQQGKISTEKIFDREIQDEYHLTIIAKDNSTMGSTTVIIQIK